MSEAQARHLLFNPENWAGKTYLNTAAEGLPLKSCVSAVMQYLQDKSQGEPGRVSFWKVYEKAREVAGRLFGATAEQTALVSSTTEALSTLANAIDWKPGDEVIFTSVEFPSNMFPWVALQKKGVITRVVSPRDGLVHIEDLIEQINPRTRLVTLSQVSYATGQHLDPRPIWEKVKNTDTLLCVDATQAAARVPVDGRIADFTIASAFKWMNSIHGTAVMTVSDRALKAGLNGPAGWLSAESCFAPDRLERFHARSDAQQFQAGMPNFDSVYSLAAAMEFHTPTVVERRRAELEPLVKTLYEGLREFGLNVLCPGTAENRAGIVPFACQQAPLVKGHLLEQGIAVQGDDNRVRAAIHWYTTPDEVQHYLSAVRKLLDKSEFRALMLAK